MVQYILSYNHYLISPQTNVFHSYIYRLAKQNLIYRRFMSEFSQTYWKETIFLSSRNILSDYYQEKIKSEGIAIYKNKYKQYKKFLHYLGRALIIGRVETFSWNVNKHNFLAYHRSQIKYAWTKGVNIKSPQQLFDFNRKDGLLELLCKNRINLLRYCTNLPVFTLVNSNQEVLLSENPRQRTYNRNFDEQLYRSYYRNNLRAKFYQGLFFINPYDAMEYKEYIEYQYQKSDNDCNIQLCITGLDSYNEFIIESPKDMKFFIIPDLKELKKMVHEYQYKSNLIFHSKQKISQDSFKGQPVYIILPSIARQKSNNKIVTIPYYNNFYSQLKNQKTAFTSYSMALESWQKFKDRYPEYEFANNPSILVYNLDEFLDVYLYETENNSTFLFLMPSKEVYDFLKLNINVSTSAYIKQGQIKNIYKIFIKDLSSTKKNAQKIVWSIISNLPSIW
uniref:Uncharacterized protein n=1 Tax=Dicranema revolutum TaxID=239144 RepID=A0A4D6WR31_9FLOR|nr:hypothetical protein [Dicranema revolutum]